MFQRQKFRDLHMDVTWDDIFIVGSKTTPRFLIVAEGDISVSPMIILVFSNRYV
jgi:hypothetical protein